MTDTDTPSPARERTVKQPRPVRRIAATMQVSSYASGLSLRKLYDLIAKGRLKSITIDRRRLILWSSLEELLK